MLNVITLFSGYDSQCLALDRSVINKPIDLLTYSSPCQDFSTAGLQRGGEAGSGTRSSLLWEVERAVKALRPKYLLLENVSALVSEKFLPLFGRWCNVLEGYGYHNTWQVMDAKDYGVPQNRERVFLVSKLDDETPYYFPKPFKLERRLRDVLEDNVPEMYYLSDERIKGIVDSMRKQQDKGNGFAFKPRTPEDIATAVTCHANNAKTENYIAEPRVDVVADLDPDNTWGDTIRQCNRVYSSDGLSPTINTYQGGGREPKIIESSRQRGKEYKIKPDGSISAVYRDPDGKVRQHNISEEQYTSPDAIAPALTLAQEPEVIEDFYADRAPREYTEVAPTLRSEREWLKVIEPSVRIRKLTPRELYRLMDVDEPRIDQLLASDIARTQHSKLAGNSIVVACLYHIFDRLFIHTEPMYGEQLKLI